MNPANIILTKKARCEYIFIKFKNRQNFPGINISKINQTTDFRYVQYTI